ncbi:MAG: hypothetical protein WDZ43_03675 [Nitrosopumilaceae archaeon]
MKNEFLFQDLYLRSKKNIIKSVVIPLSCHVCKKELNGISITAKVINGRSVFLCSHHYQAKPYQISLAR